MEEYRPLQITFEDQLNALFLVFCDGKPGEIRPNRELLIKHMILSEIPEF